MIGSLKPDVPPSGTARKYLRIRPTSAAYDPENIPDFLASLHKLDPPQTSNGLLTRLSGSRPSVYEFVALSEGKEEPVEFYFGGNVSLDTLEHRCKNIYPESFEIDQVKIDLIKKLLSPVEFSFETFQDYLEQNNLYAAASSPKTVLETPLETEVEGSKSPLPGNHVVSTKHHTYCLDDSDAIPDDRSCYTQIDRPTLTPQDTVLARPALSAVNVHGIQWNGYTPKKRSDWMTTLKTINEWESIHTDPEIDEMTDAPLTSLVEILSDASLPLAFQVVFQPYKDWTSDAKKRRYEIRHETEQPLPARILKEITDSMVTLPKEYRKAKLRRESREQEKEPPEGTEAARRLERLNSARSSTTYVANIHALSLIPDIDEYSFDIADPEGQLQYTLNSLQSVLDPLDGPFYSMKGELSSGRTASKLLRRFITGDVKQSSGIFGWRSKRPHLILDPAELATLMLVPPASQLSQTAARSTQARPRSRTPVPGPGPDQRSHLQTGMAIGQLMDETGAGTGEVVHLPPAQLPLHFVLFASTGSGKSVGINNSALSLEQNTSGPQIIIDAKGGEMLENFMRSYTATHGEDFEEGLTELNENVLYFPIPDVLPGLSFFDIRPSLENGVDRVDAVQDKADHYVEIGKLVMGADQYERAMVAPNLIKYLIKTLYDSEYGKENGRTRTSTDYFKHDQVETVLDQLRAAGPPDPNPDVLPKSSNEQTQRFLRRQVGSDPSTFQNMMQGAVSRLDYVSQDDHLRRLFNNTDPTFDFRDILHTDKKILFDLGGLRKDSAKIMAAVLITMLSDALEENVSWLSRQPEDYIVNLIIDEAPYLTLNDTMNTLLEQGREFRLSVGMCAQFPEQFRFEGDERVYLNALNNIATPIVGNIRVPDRIAEALATDSMPPNEVKTRLRSMPRGEWFVRLPSLAFGETAPDPFSVAPLPIPPGHPEGDKPLTTNEEARFQETLEEMTKHTAQEYGIEETDPAVLGESSTEVQELIQSEKADLEHIVAHALAAVQRQQNVRETNGNVSPQLVDEQIKAIYETVDQADEAPSEDTLYELRQNSELFEVDLSEETHEVVTRLSNQGEAIVERDLGDVVNVGGEAHVAGLERIEEALTNHGFTVIPMPQDSTEAPDAKAFHPNLDQPLNIEIETTTAEVPSKILTNLRKAQEAEAYPVFVVEATDDDLAYWARRVESILTPPVKREDEDGTIEYYPADEEYITFEAGPKTGGEVTAVRERGDEGDGGRSVWKREPGDDGFKYVLSDGNGVEHLRKENIDDLDRSDFPGLYRYDEKSGRYIVYFGTGTRIYDSRDDFTEEWVPVKYPLDPEQELLVPKYTHDDYVISIIPTETSEKLCEPAIYISEDRVVSFEILKEIVHGGRVDEFSMDEITPDNVLSKSALPDVDILPNDPSLGEVAAYFFQVCVFDSTDLEDDPSLKTMNTFHKGDLLILKTDLYVAFSTLYEQQTGESITRDKFAKAVLTEKLLTPHLNLGEEYEDDSGLKEVRRKVNNKRKRYYVGIGLTKSGKRYLNN